MTSDKQRKANQHLQQIKFIDEIQCRLLECYLLFNPEILRMCVCVVCVCVCVFLLVYLSAGVSVCVCFVCLCVGVGKGKRIEMRKATKKCDSSKI